MATMGQSRRWLIGAGSLLTLVAIALAGVRLGVGYLVESSDFRSYCATQLERLLHPVLPEVLVVIDRSALSGLATLGLKGVAIRSGRTLEVALMVDEIRIKPKLLSLLAGDTLAATVEARLAGTQAQPPPIGMQVQIPKAALGLERDATGDAGAMTIRGKLQQLPVEGLATLIWAEHGGPAFRVQKGVLTGTFALAKPYGAKAGGHKSGEADLRLEHSSWQFTGSDHKALDVVSLAMDLAVHDFDVQLRSPVIFLERGGQARITGSLRLPKFADHVPKWALDVQIDGGADLGHSLARLLRCKNGGAGGGRRFQVLGPVQSPECPAP